MRDDPNKFSMRLSGRAILAALIGGAALVGVAAGAEAGEGHGKKHHHYYYAPGYYAPGYVMVPPGHVRYYAPAPVVYAPRPVVVYPEPVMYGPVYPAYGSPGGVNLNISLPLR